MELKDALQGVLVKALNMTETEVSSLFTEDGVQDEQYEAVLTKHADAVLRSREKAKSDRDEQYKRGLREKGVEYEKLLKDAGVEIGDEKGSDAVQKLREHIEAQIAEKVKPSDLKEDAVKNSELYRKMEKQFQAQLTDKDKAHADYIAGRDAKEQLENTLSDVRGKSKAIIASLKPVLPEDPKKAENQLRFLLSDIEGYSFKQDDDDYVILDKEGERVEGANGHPMKLAEFVKAKAEGYFDFQVSDPKDSAGDFTKGTLQKRAKLQKPATRDALAKQLYEISEDKTLKPEERATLAKELTELSKDIS